MGTYQYSVVSPLQALFVNIRPFSLDYLWFNRWQLQRQRHWKAHYNKYRLLNDNFELRSARNLLSNSFTFRMTLR